MTSQKLPEENIGLIIAISFFAIGAFCGFFLTAIPKLTTTDWFYWTGGRILWQLGGAIWLGASVSPLFGAPRYKGAFICSLIGITLCFNPLLDVIRGPAIVEGKVLDTVVTRSLLLRSGGGASPIIHGKFIFEKNDGSQITIKPRGRQVNLWEDQFATCQNLQKMTQVRYLRHLDVVLEISCVAN